MHCSFKGFNKEQSARIAGDRGDSDSNGFLRWAFIQSARAAVNQIASREFTTK